MAVLVKVGWEHLSFPTLLGLSCPHELSPAAPCWFAFLICLVCDYKYRIAVLSASSDEHQPGPAAWAAPSAALQVALR